MAVLVINERDKPFHWTAGSRAQRDKQIAPGEIKVLSEQEWHEVPVWMRGPLQQVTDPDTLEVVWVGGLRPLDPSPQDEDSLNVTLMDYTSVNTDTDQPDGTVQLRFLGEAPTTTELVDDAPVVTPPDPLDSVWTIKRFRHVNTGSPEVPDVRISEIEVLTDVPWGNTTADREALWA